MFSLGVILFAMTTGTLPWNTESITTTQRSIINCSFQIPKTVSKKCGEMISNLIVSDPLYRLSAAMHSDIPGLLTISLIRKTIQSLFLVLLFHLYQLEVLIH